MKIFKYFIEEYRKNKQMLEDKYSLDRNNKIDQMYHVHKMNTDEKYYNDFVLTKVKNTIEEMERNK